MLKRTPAFGCILPLLLAGTFIPCGNSAAGAELEEVTVVAQRREQDLQDTPMAVTVIDSETLGKGDIHDLQGLESLVPGLSMGIFNPGQPQLFIRGIGSNEDGAAGDQSVLVAMDGVYMGRQAAMALPLFDLERVEVLRGPQGTLYGRNATAGAVHLISRQPADEFSARFEADAGNFDTLNARALVSGPLSGDGRLTGKLALLRRKRDGYLEALPVGKKSMGEDTRAVRGILRFRPDQDWDISFSADYSRLDQGPGRIPTTGIIYGLYPESLRGDYRKNLSHSEGLSLLENAGVSLTVKRRSAAGAFTSITAYRDSEFHLAADDAAVNLQLFGRELLSLADENSRQFTQELRFASAQSDAGLQWLAGYFYLREDTHRYEEARVTFPGFSLGDSFRQANVTQSHALFGEVSLALGDRLTATAGARYIVDDKSGSNIGTAGLGSAILPGASFNARGLDANFEALTPRIVLQFQANDDLQFYTGISKGFKSGGFPGQPQDLSAARTPFREESVWSYETGVKSRWRGDSLQINLAAFYMDYEDIQVLELRGDTTPVFVTNNAAQASSSGLELEWRWLPASIPGLALSGSYAYLDATYDKWLGLPAREGKRLRNAPHHAYRIQAEFTRPFAEGNLSAQIEYHHKTISFQEPDNYPALAIPAYGLLNAGLSYAPRAGRWTVALWGRNLEDEKYLIHNFPIGDGGSIVGAGTPGMPRHYGLTVSWRY